MAHEVESMMYVGDTPWHGLGTSFSEGQKLTASKAIKEAGMDWDVWLRKIHVEIAEGCNACMSNHYATVRSSDNAILGVVGKDYEPLQNKDAFKWFEPFLENEEATIETAGSLRNGARIWILAKINSEPMTVTKEDEVCHYVLLSNSHDGSLTARVGFTPIRVVCNNTLTLAFESKASQLIRVRHTRKINQNLQGIREIMDLANQELAATVKQYQKLTKAEIKSEDLDKYIRTVFNLQVPKRYKSDKIQEKIVPKVIELFEEGRGSQRAGRNYWGAYNAINEYLNYNRGKTKYNRLNSLWFGDGAQINKKALNIALEHAA